jgi:uncharacterized 2Fe-2S/4Fe-4S cluster protein (DUF4445 family)
MAKTFRVIFQPFGRHVTVAEGQTLLEAARQAGIEMNAPCGGNGTCGGCRVEITRGTPAPTDRGAGQLTIEELGRNLRLACQTRVTRDMTVVIPRETLLFDQQILESGTAVQVELQPNVRRVYFKLSPPSVEDQRSDADRILDALAERGIEATLDLSLARELPERLRKANFGGTAVVVGDRLVHFERGDSSDANYGVAVDVGTTTVVAALLDLASGQEIAVASSANPQACHGDDVVSRILYCQGSKNRARELQRLIVNCLNQLIAELCGKAGIRHTSIHEVVAVGNTTMTHLLLRLDARNIAQAPFIAALRHGVSADPRDLGLSMNARGRVYVGPNIAGFVGADTVAVILAAELQKSRRMRMAIDIGTNGELVLGNSERLLVASTAAGPAFEGARIKYGMRAAAGAIDRVELREGQLRIHTIGDAPAIGICGTGLIEAVSTCLELGIVDVTGRLLAPSDVRGLSKALAARIFDSNGDRAVILATAEESHGGHPVLLTQKDIREVQLAKAAMFAGAQVLLSEMGVKTSGLDEVLLAGAFGNFIRPERARAVGLLPDVPLAKVKFIGNAAGTGARMMLLNRRLRETAEEVSLGVEHVELSGRSDFQQLFADAMLFEH